MKAIILVIAALVAIAQAGLIAGPLLGPALVPGPITRLGIAEGPVVATGGLLGHPALVQTAIIAPQGSGIEGQYIHDNIEHLYDDGSYKIH